MIRLATVSPCYNEEEVLEHSVERLTALFDQMVAEGKISADSFMLFVNDGSRDRTWTLIEQLHRENKYVKGMDLARNVGHQRAILAGMMKAKEMADAVVTIDADLQDDLAAIPKMVDHFKAGYDVVYGELQRKMGVESVFNHADFRLMSRRALEMLSEYKERNIYLRGMIPMIGLPSTTVDDVISEREAGASKYTLKKMLNLAMDGITSFSVKPMYYILGLGILFLLTSVGIGIYVLRALILGTAVNGWSSLILSIWFTGGVVLISIGMLGIYIGRIYEEVKRRPLYHVKEFLG